MGARALVLLGTLTARCYAAGPVKLTDSSYDAFVADNAAFVISFTAPWCGHSRALMPEYEKAADSLAKEGLPVAHVDGTENEALATKLDVKGYPTIFFVRGDATIEFDGERREYDLKRWALSKLRPDVKTLASDDEIAAFAKSKTTALVLFVPTLDRQSALYNAFLAVAAKSEQPCAVSTSGGGLDFPAGSPALAMYKTFDGGAPVVLSGAQEELTRARMQKFAEVEALPLVVEYSTQGEDTLFSSTVGLHVLLFFTGAKPALDGPRAAAKALRGSAVFSLVDAAKHAEVGEYFDVQPRGSLAPPVALAFDLDASTKYAHTGGLDEASLVAFVTGEPAGLKRRPGGPVSGPA